MDGGAFSRLPSVRPQFNQIILIPALRAAGIACSSRADWALRPSPFTRPIADERKKFCMSTMTMAVLVGVMVMGLVTVWNLMRGYISGEFAVEGWVKSKPSVSVQSQKLEGWPTTVACSDILCSIG